MADFQRTLYCLLTFCWGLFVEGKRYLLKTILRTATNRPQQRFLQSKGKMPLSHHTPQTLRKNEGSGSDVDRILFHKFPPKLGVVEMESRQ